MDERPRTVRSRIEPFLGWLALLVLLIGCVVVLRPFLTSLMWAIVLSYALFPLQRRFTVCSLSYQTDGRRFLQRATEPMP